MPQPDRASGTMVMQERIAVLERELQRLRAQGLIRACVTRYMALCDRLDADTPIDELADLFTPTAVWEGRGARYAESFGSHRGRESIAAMFRAYMRTPPHFVLNVHFLCSESIDVAQDASSAAASWVMLQTSTFANGDSHLNAAQLHLQLQETGGRWRIAHFQTENLFGRPVRAWNEATRAPVPAALPTPHTT